MGYAQELARRMGGFSNFAISFSIICILAGGITSFPVAHVVGRRLLRRDRLGRRRPVRAVVAASVGQIASAYPTAGGLYHWSSILGGRGWGWLCAWINLVGLIFVVASVNFGVYLLIKDLVLTGVLRHGHLGLGGLARGHLRHRVCRDAGAVQSLRHQASRPC